MAQRGRPKGQKNRKWTPEIKKMQLQIAQLQVEIERLKKGYTTKGVGASKEFAISKDLNMK